MKTMVDTFNTLWSHFPIVLILFVLAAVIPYTVYLRQECGPKASGLVVTPFYFLTGVLLRAAGRAKSQRKDREKGDAAHSTSPAH